MDINQDLIQQHILMPFKKRKTANTKQAGGQPGKTARELMLIWQDYYVHYEDTNYSLQIQCEKCKKWRLTQQYKTGNPPVDWDCSMWITENGIGNCNLPGSKELTDDNQEDFGPGMVVWAKIKTWWPGMIEDSPEDIQYHDIESSRGEDRYHVTFFGPKVSRQWLPKSRIRPFSECPVPNLTEKLRGKAPSIKKWIDLKQAFEDASLAVNMPLKERFQNFSFAHRYDGHFEVMTEYDLPDYKEQAVNRPVDKATQTGVECHQSVEDHLARNGLSSETPQPIENQTIKNGVSSETCNGIRQSKKRKRRPSKQGPKVKNSKNSGTPSVEKKNGLVNRRHVLSAQFPLETLKGGDSDTSWSYSRTPSPEQVDPDDFQWQYADFL